MNLSKSLQLFSWFVVAFPNSMLIQLWVASHWTWLAFARRVLMMKYFSWKLRERVQQNFFYHGGKKSFKISSERSKIIFHFQAIFFFFRCSERFDRFNLRSSHGCAVAEWSKALLLREKMKRKPNDPKFAPPPVINSILKCSLHSKSGLTKV